MTWIYILLGVLIYFTGITASVYYWSATDQWMCPYYEDEDIIRALLWFIYWPIVFFLIVVILPGRLAAELGKKHREKKKGKKEW